MTRRKPEEKRELVQRFEKSGMTMREFCEREGVSFYTFRGWRQSIKREVKDEKLVEVGRTATAARSTSASLERATPVKVRIGEATVEVIPPIDEAALETVVRVLARSRC